MKSMIHNVNELENVVDEIGFLPLFAGKVPGFSVEEHVEPISWWTGIVGSRPFVIFAVFPHSRTFATIMLAYPVSMIITAALMYVAFFVKHPAKTFEKVH